ncbi:MAG: DUF4397 domain-containing protein [Chloroflexales bacterium]|nr:DUF4397 domain-containing protein [Chloroflexales bacterium]
MKTNYLPCLFIILILFLVGASPALAQPSLPSQATLSPETTALDPAPQQDPAPARLLAAHLAPFASGEASVTVRANGSDLLTDFTYTDTTSYLTLPAGDYAVEILPTGVITPAISTTVTLESGKDYTAAAIGDGTNQPLELFVLDDNNSQPFPGTGKVRIVHTAPFTSTLDATRVSIRTDDGTVVGNLDNVPYKGVSPYLDLPAGVYDLQVATLDGSTTLIDLPPITVQAGDIVTVFATGIGGQGANQPRGFLPVYGASAEPARVLLAHLAPFASGEASVTVRVDGANLLTDFTYTDTNGYLELPAGEYFVEVLPTGETTVAISGTLTVRSGRDYTAAAIGDGTNQPLELFVLDENNNPPAAGKAKVRVAHTAPFTNTLEATAVSVRNEAGAPIGGLVNFQYKQVSPYLEIDAGTYDLQVATPDGTTKLIDIPSLTLKAGDIVTVFAIGNVTNQPLSVLPVAGIARSPARVSLAHLAPFASDGAAVTVRANDADLLTNFTFGKTTPYLPLSAGSYFVEVIPAAAATAAISGTVEFVSGRDYTAAAIGDGANQQLEFLLLQDDNSAPAAGNAKVRIVHAAPFSADLAATKVSIRTETGDVVGGLTNVPYKGVSSYLELPAGAYDLQIATPDGSTKLIDVPSFSLVGSEVITVFATGDDTNQELGVLAIENQAPTGRLYLPIILQQAQ